MVLGCQKSPGTSFEAGRTPRARAPGRRRVLQGAFGRLQEALWRFQRAAESGWPPKWSLAMFSLENSMKIKIFHLGLFQNHLQPSQISLETPQSLLEPPKCSLGDSPAPRRPRARRPAGLKTGPRLFLCAFTMILRISLTQVNLYEDVPLSSRKISAYDCL